MDFKDKVVWITGGSSGIGEALAYAFDRAGAKLILSSRHADALERVRENCRGDHKDTVVLPLDLADLDSLPHKAEQALAAFGRIDILVNNGGIGQHSRASETSLKVDQALMLTNYMGQVALTKAVLPSMIRRKSGHIVVISSVTGKIGVPMRSAYAASKHALHGFFDSLRAEVWRDHVRVTVVCPGFVRTNIRVNALRADGTPFGEGPPPHPNAMSAEACAAQILSAVAKGKEEVYIGRESLAIYAYRFFPGLVSQVLRRMRRI
jgi:dehydrogenase/reductase SDR family protein 7B